MGPCEFERDSSLFRSNDVVRVASQPHFVYSARQNDAVQLVSSDLNGKISAVACHGHIISTFCSLVSFLQTSPTKFQFELHS